MARLPVFPCATDELYPKMAVGSIAETLGWQISLPEIANVAESSDPGKSEPNFAGSVL